MRCLGPRIGGGISSQRFAAAARTHCLVVFVLLALLPRVSDAQTFYTPLESMELSGNNPYSAYNQVNNNQRYHTGGDFKSALYTPSNYDTPVYPTAVGTVHKLFRTSDTNTRCNGSSFTSVSTSNRGLGNTVIISHTNGTYSLYGHLDCVDAGITPGTVIVGSTVETRIGIMGNSAGTVRRNSSGGDAFGVHLHFEIKDLGVLGNVSDVPGVGFVGYTPDLPDGYGYHDPEVFISPYSSSAIAPEAWAVLGTVPNLRIRSGPGISYEHFSWIHAGQGIIVRESSGDWFRIAIPHAEKGISGWTARTYAGETFLIPQSAAIQGEVTGAATLGLNVRTVAGGTGDSTRVTTQNGQEFMKVWDGQRYSLIAETTVGSTIWYQIDLPDSASQNQGWVSGDFIDTGSSPLAMIALAPSSLTASTVEGQNAPSDAFTVSNSGGGTLNYTTQVGAGWLSVDPGVGSSTGEPDTITVSYSTSTLSPGTYNSTIFVIDPAASNTPQTIPVTLTVTPGTPAIAYSPSSLMPTTTEGQAAPAGSFTVWNSGTGVLNYLVTDTGQTWLSVIPAVGTSTGEPDTITVSYSTAGLAPGAYSSTIIIDDAAANNTPQFIPVTLTVNPLPPTSECGNGVLETGEACDEGSGNGTSEFCCSATCSLKAAGTICRAAIGECDYTEVCSGSTGSCPNDVFAQSTVECRAAAPSCDLAEFCPGNGPACPSDASMPDGSSCTDGLFCNGADTCSAGSCSVHAGNACDGPDGDANCSESCNEAADSCTLADPNGSSCNDGDLCTVGDTCNVLGQCATGAPISCDSPGQCEIGPGTCNGSGCDYAPLTGGSCSDGSACTTSDTCFSGTCFGSPIDCDDGLFCTGPETCDTISGCQAGVPINPDDGIGCTIDTCDEANDIVVNDPQDSACGDADVCNGQETCDAISDCQPGAVVDCDDGDHCTEDSCDEISGCAHAPISNCALFTDDFNRTDDSSAGNGWTESDGGNLNSFIASNTLVMSQSGSLPANPNDAQDTRVYRVGPAHSNIFLSGTLKIEMAGPGGAQQAARVIVRSTGSGGQGSGFPCGVRDSVLPSCWGGDGFGFSAYADTIDQNPGGWIQIVDDGVELVEVSFAFTNGVTYNWEMEIDADNHVAVYTWTGVKPLTPTLAFDNGGAPYTPMSAGTFWQIEAKNTNDNIGISHTNSATWDDFKVTGNQSVAPVPSLSPFGLLILVSILVGVALRRRGELENPRNPGSV